jgi:hypothetical protein
LSWAARALAAAVGVGRQRPTATPPAPLIKPRESASKSKSSTTARVAWLRGAGRTATSGIGPARHAGRRHDDATPPRPLVRRRDGGESERRRHGIADSSAAVLPAHGKRQVPREGMRMDRHPRRASVSTRRAPRQPAAEGARAVRAAATRARPPLRRATRRGGSDKGIATCTSPFAVPRPLRPMHRTALRRVFFWVSSAHRCHLFREYQAYGPAQIPCMFPHAASRSGLKGAAE